MRPAEPTRALSILAVLGIAAVATGCAGAPADSGAIGASRSQETSMTMAPSGEVPSDLLAAITGDAAERAGVTPDEVTVLIAESVTWNDGSLGCPEPGMMYTQALVPGYRVVVDAGGEEMSFHASDRGDFRFCENPEPPMEGDPNE